MPTLPQVDVTAQIPMVEALVSTKFATVPDHIAGRDDLIQVGLEAILKAAPRWRPDGGASFRNFAYQRAWGGIQDYLRSVSFGGRTHFTEFSITSLDAPAKMDDGEGDTLANTLVIETDFPDPHVRDAIEEALRGCTLEDAQSVFALVHEEGLNLREVGEMMGITESRVHQILNNAHKAIAAHPAMDGLL